MKKVFALLLISLTVLTSCSKDDDNEDINSSNFLIGKWESKEDYTGEEVSLDIDGEFVYTYTDVMVTTEQNGEEVGSYEYTFNPKNMELRVHGDMIFVEKISNDKMVLHNGKDGEEYRGTLFHRIN
ncbi:hypothetical protein [Christiangramia aquimixticola]|uniref:hypothetical protein n=1 Tax=Christiangramia aquimixticola TaxID=1697558 RepID=UPI003AA96122